MIAVQGIELVKRGRRAIACNFGLSQSPSDSDLGYRNNPYAIALRGGGLII
jgi:hypothetical protein